MIAMDTKNCVKRYSSSPYEENSFRKTPMTSLQQHFSNACAPRQERTSYCRKQYQTPEEDQIIFR